MSNTENLAIIKRNGKIRKLVQEKIELVKQRDMARNALRGIITNEQISLAAMVAYRNGRPHSTRWQELGNSRRNKWVAKVTPIVAAALGGQFILRD